MNPCHCAPTIEFDDGTGIWESNAGMRFLCVTAGEKGEKLYPKDPIIRAKIDIAMDWRQISVYPCIPSIGYFVFGLTGYGDDAKARADFKTLLEEVSHFDGNLFEGYEIHLQ
jgi:glutathione S-transferase